MPHKYLEHSGKIAELLVEIFLAEHSYIVQKIGIENTVGSILSAIDPQAANSAAQRVLENLMTIPDLLVFSLDDASKVKEAYMIEVKFRTYQSRADFEAALSSGGEIYKQAEKYSNYWDIAKLFLIVCIKNEDTVEIYYDSTNKVAKKPNKFVMQKLDTYSWVKQDVLLELKNKAKELLCNPCKDVKNEVEQ